MIPLEMTTKVLEEALRNGDELAELYLIDGVTIGGRL
jgi:hypothetical protein